MTQVFIQCPICISKESGRDCLLSFTFESMLEKYQYNYLPQFADNCRISFCARHGGTRLQSRHLGTRRRAGVQSWPRLHEILSLKRASVVNLCKMGKVCVPLPPKYVNELKKDLNPIPLHHAVHGKRPLQYSYKRTDDRYISPRSQQPAAC